MEFHSVQYVALWNVDGRVLMDVYCVPRGSRFLNTK